AKHVEEQAVDFVPLERLSENRQRVLAIVLAIDTGGIETVVDYRFTVRATEEPFRMRVEHRLLRLAQIEASDDANSSCVGLADDVAEEIAAGWEEAARIVKGYPRRVLRDDPSHVHEERIGSEVSDSVDERFGIDRRIVFAQIGLEKTNRLRVATPVSTTRCR